MEEKKIKVMNAKVLDNQRVSSNSREIVLGCDDLDVNDLIPGQFFCLEPFEKNSAMARPFSVSRRHELFNAFSFVYRVIGANTMHLALIKRGEKIKIWGPLGKGFDPFALGPHKVGFEFWLVGGGIGIAPLRHFAQRTIGAKTKILYGVKSKEEIIDLHMRDCIEDPVSIEIATEDGSAGYHGLVTNLFSQKITEVLDKNILVITCGPKAMMKQVAEICAQNKINCYATLETIMACGIGACLGCSIKMQSGEMKRICHDGPVFNAKEVDWDALS